MTGYRLVPDRCRLEAVATSSLHPVRVSAERLDGDAELVVGGGAVALEPAPQASIRLAAAELRSGSALYDGEIRRRIEVGRYPTVTGALGSARETAPGRYRVSGELSFHGVTRTVEADVVVKVGEDSLEAHGELVLDIRDFGLSPPRVLTLRVSPEVQVRFEVVAEPSPDRAEVS